ncbi:CotH kinase family protein [Lactobacillus intestinalis]|uniref:CotH kinase family protein n=1 Tax=Lactobacillus intestinalis TaxID=151781 RepID=UPI00272B8568|nr:CotH kinase family protein [Lactobacillus intestinalis]
MVNSRDSLSKIPSTNHDGTPYILDLDIYKEGYWAYDISNYYKGRVDDNGTPFQVRWFEHGQIKNVQGLRPFIRGTIGQHTVDDETDPDNPKVVPSPDCSQIDQTGETTDTMPGGIAVYRMVNQCFTQEGMFYGEIGLKDSSGLVLSSVDIAFKVLGGRMNMVGARKFYVSEFEKAIDNLNAIIEKTKKDFSHQLSQVITDARSTYNTQVKNSKDALNALDGEIRANRQEQANLSERLVGTEQQIAEHDVVTKAKHFSDIKAISDAINQRLAKMKTAPVGVADFNSLIQEYPSGADGVFITQDTKHIYTYLNNAWQDLGIYQAMQLDKDTIESIYDTKGKSLGTDLIANGSFGTDSAVPAFANTNDTNLSVSPYLTRKWLTITSSGTSQYKGACWNIDKQNGEIFGYPLRLAFDVQSAENTILGINFVFYNADGKRLGSQSPIPCTLSTWRFLHYEDTIKFDDKYKDCASIVMQIITNDSKPIKKIMLTAVSLSMILDNKTGTDLIANGSFGTDSAVPAFANTNDTNLSVSPYLTRKWLTITSSGTSQYKGACWNIDKQNGEIFGYPLRLAFDVQSAENTILGINFVFYNADGKRLGSQSPIPCTLSTWRFLHYEDTIKFDDKYKDCASIVMQIITNDSKPIKKIMLTAVSLSMIFDVQASTQYLENKHRLPIVTFTGNLDGISGDKFVNVSWSYTSKSTTLQGYGAIKWQGSSSMAYPKKSYRLKTLKSDFKTKDKIKILPSWNKHSKFNLKAYYTDGLMSRDPTNASIGGAIWASQRNIPKDLIDEDNFGFVDGFPVALYINGKFYGIYSFNLPRPDFDYTKYALIGNMYNELTQFKSQNPNVKLDGSDFEILNLNGKLDEIKTAVNSLISFVSTSSDEDFKQYLSEHINLESVIDYFIFSNIIGNGDAWGKNQVLLSWDGKIWYWQPYDLDVSYSAQFDGTVSPMPTNLMGSWHKVFDRVNQLYSDKIKERYSQIRSWLTPSYVLDRYRSRINEIGTANFEAEHNKWNNPAKDTEDFKQLTENVYHQFKLLDKVWIEDSSQEIEILKNKVESLMAQKK